MNKLYTATSAAFMSAFIFFTYLVKRDKFVKIDFDTAVRIKDHMPIKFDQLFAYASAFGTVWIITIVLLAILIKQSWRTRLSVLFLYFAGQGLEYVLKIKLRQPGPPFQFQRHFTQAYFDKDYVQQGYSYPSGHSFRAVFITMLIVAYCIRKYGYTTKTIIYGSISIAAALFIMLGKIVLGAHLVNRYSWWIALGNQSRLTQPDTNPFQS